MLFPSGVILHGVYNDMLKLCAFLSGALCEEDLALYQPAWATYYTNDPPSNAVDNDPTTNAYTGITDRPFFGVDLGSAVSVGRVLVVFGWSKYSQTCRPICRYSLEMKASKLQIRNTGG